MEKPFSVTTTVIQEFLQQLSQRVNTPTILFLLGGSALCLLGSERSTLDIDYVGNDRPDPQDELQQTIRQVASEMQIEVEGVPIEYFIPLPDGAQNRHRLFAQYDNLDVYLFDPYSIALSKIDRGFESDLEDVFFLLQQGLIELSTLEQVVQTAMPQAKQFAMDAVAMAGNLNTIKQMLTQS